MSSACSFSTCALWNKSPLPWFEREVEVSPREHATQTHRELINPVRTNSRKGSGSLSGNAQSLGDAYTEATGNRLEDSARINYRVVVD